MSSLPLLLPLASRLRRINTVLHPGVHRRQGAVLAGASAVFALVFVVLIGQTLRILLGDSAALVWLGWAAISSVLGAASALVLASCRRLERSIV